MTKLREHFLDQLVAHAEGKEREISPAVERALLGLPRPHWRHAPRLTPRSSYLATLDQLTGLRDRIGGAR
jgi:hypothetical protein